MRKQSRSCWWVGFKVPDIRQPKLFHLSLVVIAFLGFMFPNTFCEQYSMGPGSGAYVSESCAPLKSWISKSLQTRNHRPSMLLKRLTDRKFYHVGDLAVIPPHFRVPHRDVRHVPFYKVMHESGLAFLKWRRPFKFEIICPFPGSLVGS